METMNEQKDVARPDVGIPENLGLCLEALKKLVRPDELEEFMKVAEMDVCTFHPGLGRWIRNNWGLWSGSKLSQWFNGKGIYHPDDMSGIILTSFHRHLNNRSIGLDGQIKYYQEYWAQVKENVDGLRAVEGEEKSQQETARLAKFFQEEWPGEIKEGSAVDNAIRLLREMKRVKGENAKGCRGWC